MDKYFDEFDKAIENMTDEELEELLIKSGIEKCHGGHEENEKI